MAENEAEQAATPTEKKFGKLNSLILVVVILLLEGGTIFITVKLAGGPKQASGMVVAEEQEDPAKQIIEQLVVEMRAPNMKTGKTYLYDFTVVATFKQEDLETVKEELAKREHMINDRLRTIVATSDPKDLNEPGLETLRRRIKHKLEAIFESEDLVQEVLIPKCTPFRTDV